MENIVSYEGCLEHNQRVLDQIKEVEVMEDSFLEKDLQFLAEACRSKINDLQKQIYNPGDYPHMVSHEDSVDEDPVQEGVNLASEGENSLRFRVLRLLKEGEIQRSAEVVTSYIMDALGDMGPSVDGLRNMDRLVACSLRVIFAHWARKEV